ncbi:MAG TPA: hypothetical protein PKA82_13690 [Pyrinomonadaceae bacterium]|nr:hypothetical protein [Pyrinomonadaceae bacterium]
MKNLNSSAYVSSVNFTGLDSGFALFGGQLLRIENNRLKNVKGLPLDEDEIVFSQFIDPDRGCISYSNGGVACTKNGAVTFQTFETLSDVRPWNVSVNDRAVILVGQTPPNELNGKVVNQIGSLDGKKLSLMPQEFKQIWFSERGCYGLAVNQANQLSATSDCGFIWNDMAKLDSRPDEIFILDELNIWLFKDGVFHSKDGGRNWRKLATFASNEIVEKNDMVFVDSKHGWIASLFRLFETKDGGATWKEVKLP